MSASKRRRLDTSSEFECTGEELGRGGFSVIYLGVFNKNRVAVKKIPLDWMASQADREVEAQTRFNHPNVLKLMHVDRDENFKYLVLDLCAGSLDQFFLAEDHPRKYKGPMPSDHRVIYDIASGLSYIHSQKFVHRDVQPDNVLISLSQPVRLMISDFGLSKPTSGRGSFSISGNRGSSYWLAPEILELFGHVESSNSGGFRATFQSDIFSAGCVLFFYLARGVHPFGSTYFIPANILQNNPVNFNNLQAEDFVLQIIRRMIAKEKGARIPLPEIIQIIQNTE